MFRTHLVPIILFRNCLAFSIGFMHLDRECVYLSFKNLITIVTCVSFDFSRLIAVSLEGRTAQPYYWLVILSWMVMSVWVMFLRQPGQCQRFHLLQQPQDLIGQTVTSIRWKSHQHLFLMYVTPPGKIYIKISLWAQVSSAEDTSLCSVTSVLWLLMELLSVGIIFVNL